MRPPLLSALVALATAFPAASFAQTAAAAEAEAAKCLDRIASVRREVLGKYEDQLMELQNQAQKGADLDNALIIRGERQRLEKDKVLSAPHFVDEPKSLRTLQQQTVSHFEELCAAVVAESIPKLVELKKSLTVAGQLDDAVTVRNLITKLQNDHVPLVRPANGDFVSIDTLVTAYAADRTRADQAYKDVRIAVRGNLAAYRLDANDSRKITLYLGRTSGTGWVACFFEGGIRFREDKAFNNTALVVLNAGGQILARWSTGQPVEIQGTCSGFEDVVRLVKCELTR